MFQLKFIWHCTKAFQLGDAIKHWPRGGNTHSTAKQVLDNYYLDYCNNSNNNKAHQCCLLLHDALTNCAALIARNLMECLVHFVIGLFLVATMETATYFGATIPTVLITSQFEIIKGASLVLSINLKSVVEVYKAEFKNSRKYKLRTQLIRIFNDSNV